MSTYDPTGPLEMALIEKIGLCLWRQRRIVLAEVGSITIQQHHTALIRRLNGITGKKHFYQGGDTEPPLKEDYDFVSDVLREVELLNSLGDGEALTVKVLEKMAPVCYAHLQETLDMNSDYETVEDVFLEEAGGDLEKWLWNLRSFALDHERDLKERATNTDLLDAIRNEKCVLGLVK
jgi:hypothetical protein